MSLPATTSEVEEGGKPSEVEEEIDASSKALREARRIFLSPSCFAFVGLAFLLLRRMPSSRLTSRRTRFLDVERSTRESREVSSMSRRRYLAYLASSEKGSGALFSSDERVGREEGAAVGELGGVVGDSSLTFFSLERLDDMDNREIGTVVGCSRTYTLGGAMVNPATPGARRSQHKTRMM